MSENIGNLYVRSESEEEVSTAQNSPKRSTSLSSLRSLRDTFKRSESRASQTSLASATISEAPDNGSDSVSPVVKASKSFLCVSSKTDEQSQATKLLNYIGICHKSSNILANNIYCVNREIECGLHFENSSVWQSNL